MTRRSRPATRRRRPVEVTDWRVILGGDDRDSGIFAADDFAAIDLLDVADALRVDTQPMMQSASTTSRSPASGAST